MKRSICLILSFLFIMLCFVGCGQNTTTVTAENVKELFTPTLKAAMYELGSYFYEFEKNENGILVEYPSDDDVVIGYFKIETEISKDEIIEEFEKYVKDGYSSGGTSAGSISECIYEKDGDLYVPYPNYGEALFDVNSITLVETTEDGYRISVDIYGTAGADWNTYSDTRTYFVKTVDGVLQIQELIDLVTADPINDSDNLDLFGTQDKFLGSIQERIS